MPKEITHWILAEKAYQNIDADSALKTIIHSYKNLYLAGAVIMDTPFYQLYGEDREIMNKSGQKLHDNPVNSYEPLECVISSFVPHVPDDVLSFLLGIVSHIHADSSFHPLVCYFSNSNFPDHKEGKKRAALLHRTLEAYLDIYYTQEFQLQNKRLFSEVLSNVEMEEKRFLKLLSLLFSDIPGILRIKKTLRLHAHIQKLFDNNMLKIMLWMLNLIPGTEMEDYIASFYPLRKPDPKSIFLYPFLYRHPVTGEKLQHSVKELEKKAVREILNVFGLIEYHMNNNSLAKAFSDLKGPNLYTGIVGTRESDMNYFSTGKNLMKLIYHGSG